MVEKQAGSMALRFGVLPDALLQTSGFKYWLSGAVWLWSLPPASISYSEEKLPEDSQECNETENKPLGGFMHRANIIEILQIPPSKIFSPYVALGLGGGIAKTQSW